MSWVSPWRGNKTPIVWAIGDVSLFGSQFFIEIENSGVDFLREL